MRLEDLVERAAEYDETLARDIKDYVHGRKYGLVYEASKPEFVRMWNKPIVRGDIVNILPPRGEMEDTKSEEDPSEIVYQVIGIEKGNARLRNEENGDQVEAAVDDIVALARFDKPIYAGLKEVDRIERGGDKPYQMVINGENYHALQTLVYAYQGMVDCIYIDPPYNTGAKDWKYNNNYVGADDVYRHSKWLTLMEDRLKLAKKMLNPKTGVIVVTIDEHEVHRLRLLLEQLFPEFYIQMVTYVSNPTGSTQGRFSRIEEYAIYCFAPEAYVDNSDDPLIGENKKEKAVRWKSLLRSGPSAQRADRKNMFYPVYVDVNKGMVVKAGAPLPFEKSPDYSSVDGYEVAWPIRTDGSEGRWSVGAETLNALISKGYVQLGKYDAKRKTYGITYISNEVQKQIEEGEIIITDRNPETGVVTIEYKASHSQTVRTVWYRTRHNAGVYGTNLLNSIVGSRYFSFPKSLYVTFDSISNIVNHNKDALIVDFFAGSGTTLHAVNLMNARDNGRRRCICVTNNEVSADEQTRFAKQGLRQGDFEWEQYGIAKYVTWPRTKCTIEGIDIKGNPLKGNYGCSTEMYKEYEGEVVDIETGKKKRKKLYEKVDEPSYSDLADYKMAEGFNENAIFFDIEYLEPAIVSADLAYESIAPILWMCGGCKGEILKRHKGYTVGETYAVLFDPRFTRRFVDVVLDNENVRTVFIVTDASERYRSLCSELTGRRVLQLYESYLRSFEINAIG